MLTLKCSDFKEKQKDKEGRKEKLNQENMRKNDTQVHKKRKNGMYKNTKIKSKERQRMKDQ
jgi:hypothetical protein